MILYGSIGPFLNYKLLIIKFISGMDLILQEIRKHNKELFKRFFDKHYVVLVKYANNYVYDIQVSEDIVQESFIYIWENADKLKVDYSLKAYLFKMVKNRSLNHLKSIKITDDLGFIDLNTKLYDDEIDTIDIEDDNFTENKVRSIVNGLPDRMREIITLKYYQGYKYSEISNELGISINTVKTQLKRAKLRISELLLLLFTFL